MKTASLALIVVLAGVAFACRGEPTGDPKTPANSPVPEIEHRDPDPKPSLGDAG